MKLTPADVQHLLSSLSHHPVHAWGQNFLLDLAVVDQIVTATTSDQPKTVLEIGPGLGILTKELLTSLPKGELIVVERDLDLANRLIKLFGSQANFNLIKGDIVRYDRAHLVDGKYVLAANLPFAVTNFVLNTYLTTKPRPSKLVLMVQREVADRLLAKPGDSARGLLSIIAERYSERRRLVEVPRTSFWPIPKVDATVIELTIKQDIKSDDQAFFTFVRRLFAGRRKQLINTLGASIGLNKDKSRSLLEKLSIKLTSRPQELTLKQWQDLYDSLS